MNIKVFNTTEGTKFMFLSDKHRTKKMCDGSVAGGD